MSRASKICANCSGSFAKDPRNTWAYWEKAKYCSQKCAGIAWSKERKSRRPSIKDKFATYTLRTEGCWIWTGLKDKDGYGLFVYARTMHRAARIALMLDGRPVPDGLYACHHCDNPICVRPDHLYPGTPKQNSADAMTRGRINPGTKAKLSRADILAIRAATGTHAEIASKFGVAPSNVTMIRNRRTWRHVP